MKHTLSPVLTSAFVSLVVSSCITVGGGLRAQMDNSMFMTRPLLRPSFDMMQQTKSLPLPPTAAVPVERPDQPTQLPPDRNSLMMTKPLMLFPVDRPDQLPPPPPDMGSFMKNFSAPSMMPSSETFQRPGMQFPLPETQSKEMQGMTNRMGVPVSPFEMMQQSAPVPGNVPTENFMQGNTEQMEKMITKLEGVKQKLQEKLTKKLARIDEKLTKKLASLKEKCEKKQASLEAKKSKADEVDQKDLDDTLDQLNTACSDMGEALTERADQEKEILQDSVENDTDRIDDEIDRLKDMIDMMSEMESETK